ncbi:MAG: hypothetical protein JSS27_00610 [Planctomycetes bacterium]|nr:hypothetical protein [Planctomycetota bacterium]
MSTPAGDISKEQIERVVREVLARLMPAAAGEHVASETKPKTPSDTVSIAGQVITVAALDGRLTGKSKLQVNAKAVITPAARDLLKAAGVTVVRGTAGAAASAALNVVIGRAQSRADAATLVAALRSQKLNLEQVAQTGLVDSVGALAIEAARGGKLAVLVTEATSAALCLANRRAGVRAALVDGQSDVNELAGTLGANFLIVSLRGASAYQLGRAIAAVATWPGERGCPKLLAALDKS